ncbi:MAG: DUF6314 family protein [Pseudomonadota bacterium]
MIRSLTDFLGRYAVSRTIEDHLTGQKTLFEGHAEIAGSKERASYTEVGTLRMGAQSFAAERRYEWRVAGDRIAVLFDDGRPFHDFDPSTGGQATEHLCGQDLYRGGYDFSEWTCWAVTWDVKGPRKDYRSVTWYVREG